MNAAFESLLLGKRRSNHKLIFAGIPVAVVVIVLSLDKDNYGLVTYGGTSGVTADKL